MKKKKLLLPVLAFASIFANVQATQAMTISEGNERWWSIEELTKMSKEAESERMERCGEDIYCQMDMEFEQMQRDSKYYAINMLDNLLMRVTGVNVAKNEITVFVDKDDITLKRMGFPYLKGEVNFMELAWAEGDYPEHVDFANYHDHIWGGREVDNLHILYTFDGSDKFLDKKETVLKIKDANLSDNNTNIIKFFTQEDNGSNVMGSVDYGECINSANYTFGMDCRMMISENSTIKFVPFNPELEDIIIDMPTELPPAMPESQVQIESGLTPEEAASELESIFVAPEEEAVSEPLPPEEEAANKLKPMPAPEEATSTEPGTDKLLAEKEPETKLLADDDNILPTNNYIDETNTGKIKAPDTGKYSGSTQKSSWWLLFLAILMGILWGIGQILQKNQKKVQKSLKKSLTLFSRFGKINLV